MYSQSVGKECQLTTSSDKSRGNNALRQISPQFSPRHLTHYKNLTVEKFSTTFSISSTDLRRVKF